jgi:uncharacterized protein YegP (UPF0339 family)
MSENQCRGCGAKSQYLFNHNQEDVRTVPNVRWCPECGTVTQFDHDGKGAEFTQSPRTISAEPGNQIYQFSYWRSSHTGQYWWNLKSTVNGQIVAAGEGYHNKMDVIETIGNIRRFSRWAEIVDLGVK